MLISDLHIHSKFSRATSKDCDLEHLEMWARKTRSRISHHSILTVLPKSLFQKFVLLNYQARNVFVET